MSEVTEEQKLAVLGITTMLITQRLELDKMEATAATYLERIGGRPGEGSFANSVRDYVGEATYNSGDDPERAAAELMEAVGLDA